MPLKLNGLIAVVNLLVDAIRGETGDRLEEVWEWGRGASGIRCLLRKAPEFVNRLSYVQSALPATVYEPLVGLSRQLAAPAGPVGFENTQWVPPPQSGVACSTPAESPGTAGNEQNARLTFASYDDMCENVQWLMVRLTRDLGGTVTNQQTGEVTGLGAYKEFVKAVDAKRFRKASTLLLRSAACSTEPPEDPLKPPAKTDCNLAVSRLLEGCPIPIRWAEAPSWILPNASVAPRLTASVSSFITATRTVGWTVWNSVTIALSLTLAVRGKASCAHLSYSSMQARLSQPLSMTFYSQTAIAMNDTLAAATADALYLLPDGKLCVTPGAVAKWWEDHDAVYFDASTIGHLRESPQDVCARAATSNSSSVVIDLGFHQGNPAFRVTSRPATRTLELAGLSHQPWSMHVAPGVVCQTRCNQGLTVKPRGIAAKIDLPPLPSASAKLISCLVLLQRDYASCTMKKNLADRRFRMCIFGSSDSTLDDASLAAYYAANNVSSADGDQIRFLLACDTFTRANARYCSCAPGAELRVSRIGRIAQSVGRMRDTRAVNRPTDLVALRDRLWSLGYAQTTASSMAPKDSCEDDVADIVGPAGSYPEGPRFVHAMLSEHLLRVFLCASAGEMSFESECDAQRINGNCAVRTFTGLVECPARAITVRDTCTRVDLRCTEGLVNVGSPEHDWLRASEGSPKWERLPRQGEGFVCEGDEALLFGTSWLIDALVVAGRKYKEHMLTDPNVQPLIITQGSGREGGAVPNDPDFQTGMQLKFEMPMLWMSQFSIRHNKEVDWVSALKQAEALEAAGFTTVKMKAWGEGPTCELKPSLCIASDAKFYEMRARIGVPPIAYLPLLPNIVTAALAVADDQRSALLMLNGTDLGYFAEDVLRVAVGDHDCKMISHVQGAYAFTAITAMCTMVEEAGWLSGVATVTTAYAGQGAGAVPLSAFLKSAFVPLAPPSPPPLTDYSGVPPRAQPFEALQRVDAAAVGNVDAGLSLRDLKRLQDKLRGRLPTCAAPAPPPCGMDLAFVGLPPTAPPPPAPALVLDYPANLQLPWPGEFVRAPTDRETPPSTAGDCTWNVAHKVYGACTAELYAPHFPHEGSGMFDFAFDLAASRNASLRAPIVCDQIDTTAFIGTIRLPVAPSPLDTSFEAKLPSTGAPTNFATGLPEGFLLSVGLSLGRDHLRGGGHTQPACCVVERRDRYVYFCDDATKAKQTDEKLLYE